MDDEPQGRAHHPPLKIQSGSPTPPDITLPDPGDRPGGWQYFEDMRQQVRLMEQQVQRVDNIILWLFLFCIQN